MDNNAENQHNIKAIRGKRIKTVIIASVILLPTLFAIILFALISNGILSGSDKLVYDIRIYDTAGKLIGEDSSYPNDAEEGSIVALFAPITRGFAATTELPDTLDMSRNFKAIITYEGNTDEYVFYLSTIDDVGYCTVNKKKNYRLTDEDVQSILSSKFAEVFYNTSVPPSLYSSAGDIILPDSVYWRYKVASGEYFKSSSYMSTNETIEYVMAGSLSLFFSADPDICNITVSQNGNEYYSGNYVDMPELSIDKSKPVNVYVEAEWSQKEEGNYHGRINYSFIARTTETPDFSILSSEISANSFFGIRAVNIEDVSRLKVNITPYVPSKISFCQDKYGLLALVPITTAMRGNNYEITVSYGAIRETFNVSVPYEGYYGEKSESPVSNEIFNERFGPGFTKEIDSLRVFCSLASYTDKLYSGEFLNYEELGATRYSRYGDEFYLTLTRFYSAIGSEYRFESGTGIGVPALNNGKVIKTGFNGRLGNYVIVSHGVGLTTWYTNLSIIDVTEGQYVAKGEKVGKTGTSGLCDKDNVTVIATIGSEFIDVTYLYDSMP